MKKLYAIAVLDLAYLRDFKLSQLDDEQENKVPEWNKLLKVTSVSSMNFGFNIIQAHEYTCQITKLKCRIRLNSASRWKTLKGAQSCLENVEKNGKLLTRIKNRMGTNFGFYIVSIEDTWENTIKSEIAGEKVKHEIILERLYRKLK